MGCPWLPQGQIRPTAMVALFYCALCSFYMVFNVEQIVIQCLERWAFSLPSPGRLSVGK